MSRSWIAAGVAAVVVTASSVIGPPPAESATNGIAVGVFPDFPTRVAFSSTNVAGSITLINGSSGAEATGSLTVTDLTLVPSCGNFTPTCAGAADPGVFQLSTLGTGGVGTVCAGASFDITVIDPATGRVRFRRSDGAPIRLGQTDITSDSDTCVINFTLANLRMPTIDSHPTVGEVQTNQVGFMSVSHPNGSTGTDQGEDVTTIVAPPTTTTTSTTTTTKPPTTTTTTTTLPPTTTTTTKPPTTTTTTTTIPPTTTTTTRPPTTTSTTTTIPPTTTTTKPPTTTTTTTLPPPTTTKPTTTTTVPVPSQHARFVDRAYRDLLGRAPAAWETSFWLDAISQGYTRAGIATALTTSWEFRRNVVTSYYVTLLGRGPTADELNALVSAIEGGWPFEYVETIVLGGDEYYARQGASPGAFIDGLYVAVLGLPPDPPGRAFWVDQMTNQGLDRYSIALAFTTHAITHDRIAVAASHWLLRRAPTPAERSYWTSLLQDGVRQEQLFAAMVASEEYWSAV